MLEWEKHWEVGSDKDKQRPETWRRRQPGDVRDDSDMQESGHDHCFKCADIKVTRAEILDYRRIMRSFKNGTAVAYDNLRPHQLDYLSDQAITELIKLYKRCEMVKCWPEAWRHATMVMIPKAIADLQLS